MQKYKVQVTQTITRVVEIEAPNEGEALSIGENDIDMMTDDAGYNTTARIIETL